MPVQRKTLHASDQNLIGDTEADTSLEAGRETFLGEKI